MIRIINTRDNSGNYCTIDLVADTKSEVADNMDLQSIGLPKDTIIRLGSTIITSTGDYAIRNSSGEWVWSDD